MATTNKNFKVKNGIDAAGAVTAQSFSGSGEGLTNIPNEALENSSITINGESVDLGGSITLAGDIEGVTAGTGLTGGGTSGTVTLSIDSTVATLSGVETLSNKILRSPKEIINIVASAATGTINFDVLTAGVWFYTSNASANFTLNFRGNSGTTLASALATGDAVTVVFLNTNGATPYYPNTFQIDGSAVTPKWQGGTAPSAGNASSIDAYTFTIIKTATTPTYTVLAAQTKFS